MKHKFLIALALALVICLFMSGCAAGNMDSMAPSEGGGSIYDGIIGDSYKDEAIGGVIDGAPGDVLEGDVDSTIEGVTSEEYTADADEKPEEQEPTLKPGQLTAAAYFDIEHFEFLRGLTVKGQDGKYGVFANTYNTLMANLQNSTQYNAMNLSLEKAYILTFKGVKNGYVQLYEGDILTATSSTDVNGRCILFGKYGLNDKAVDGRKAVVTYTVEGSAKVEEFAITSAVQEFEASEQGVREDKIEIMFVIDTTGSMGDEMSYLKAEIDDVIARVAEQNPNTPISLALLFYRDDGDEYVTRYFNFTENIAEQKANLAVQSANGGGDFPEAVDTALSEALLKNWSGSSATKLIVHVADAPAHSNKYVDWMATAQKLAERNIAIITVASSGIDKQTEFYFRMQSLITNGCYVYLTNDSGIGGDHLEPTLEVSPTVEHLNSLLVRIINGYHTGDFGTAVHWQQEQ